MKTVTLKISDIKYLQEGIIFQSLIANKLCNSSSLYRSPSQTTYIFDQLADNQLANHNPSLIIVLGNLNLKSENWHKHSKASCKGAKIDALVPQFDYSKLLKSLLML